MTITPQMVLEAIKTGHDGCDKGCVHADALAANIENIVTIAAAGVYSVGISPSVALITEAFHVGFRTAQLVAKAEMDHINKPMKDFNEATAKSEKGN